MQISRISFGQNNNLSLRALKPEAEKNTDRNIILNTSIDYLNLIDSHLFVMSMEKDMYNREVIRQDANSLIKKIIYNLQQLRNEN